MQTWHPNLSGIGKMAAEQNMLNDFEREERIRHYRSALENTTDSEWRYEMAEGINYIYGHRHMSRLWALQVELDPEGVIWKSIAPKGFAIPQPRVRSAA